MRINHFVIGKIKHCHVFTIHAILSLRPQDRQAGNEKELKKEFQKKLANKKSTWYITSRCFGNTAVSERN
jgi:hypothetical protein